MNRLKFLRRYGAFVVIGIILIVILAFAFSEPHYHTFALAHQLKRVLALFLGVLYGIAQGIVGITLLGVLPIGIFLAVGIWGVWQLWKARRYPALIPVTALIGANMLFFGAPQFLDVGRLVERLVICEDYFITGTVGFQVIRHPVQTRLRDDAQTFVLLSDDGGTTWRQIFQAYAISPQLHRCENIRANFGDGTTWAILLEQRIGNSIENNYYRYFTADGGKTFERQDP